MDREAWHSDFHGVAKSQTRLSNRTELIVIHTVQGLDTVNKSDIDVSLELSCFFDPANAGN